MEDKKIPYPRPNYEDKFLFSKELTAGVFVDAIFDETRKYAPAMMRYSARISDIYTQKLATNFNESSDILIGTYDLGALKQAAWLPMFVRHDKERSADIVYYPLDYYDDFEFFNGYIDTGAPAVGVRFTIPHYDKHNAGLFGLKLDNDTVTSVWFLSLKDYSIRKLGDIPSELRGVHFDYAGYMKGAAPFVFDTGGSFTYLLFDFDGSVHRIDGAKSRTIGALGDLGAIALLFDNDNKTSIFNSKGELEHVVPGDFITSYYDTIDGVRPYPFSAKVGKSVYRLRDENSCYKFKKTNSGWKISIKQRPIWAYSKRHLYDYSTDNWINDNFGLKFLHYNFILNDIDTKDIKRLPCYKTGKFCKFTGSDEYADFVEVWNSHDSRSGAKLYHTFDFHRWDEITDTEAVNGFYENWCRIWVDGRADDIVGFLPYAMESYDIDGVVKIYFKGFIFRRRSDG